MRTARRIGAVALVAAMGLTLAVRPAQAADLNGSYPTWRKASAAIGKTQTNPVQGTLYAPTYKAGLKQTGKVQVVLDSFKQGKKAKHPKGDMIASTSYGKVSRDVPFFWLSQKFNGTQWAADPIFTTSTAPVGTFPVTIGPEGQQYTLQVKISADCFPQPADTNPTPIPDGFTCQQSDLATGGGYAQFTLRPYSIMNFSPNPTTVFMTTNKIAFDDIVKIIQGLSGVME